METESGLSLVAKPNLLAWTVALSLAFLLVDVCAECKYSAVSGLGGQGGQGAGEEDGDQHGRGAEPEGVRGLCPDARLVLSTPNTKKSPAL